MIYAITIYVINTNQNSSKNTEENTKKNAENHIMKASYDFTRDVEVCPGLSIQSIFPLSMRPETFNDNKSLIYFGIGLFQKKIV